MNSMFFVNFDCLIRNYCLMNLCDETSNGHCCLLLSVFLIQASNIPIIDCMYESCQTSAMWIIFSCLVEVLGSYDLYLVTCQVLVICNMNHRNCSSFSFVFNSCYTGLHVVNKW